MLQVIRAAALAVAIAAVVASTYAAIVARLRATTARSVLAVSLRPPFPRAHPPPCLPACSNHEIWFDFEAYRARFAMPARSTSTGGPTVQTFDSMYYSFQAGPSVHIAVANTESPIDTADMNSTVTAWLASDLAAATANRSASVNPWLIVGGHRPFYCSNDDKTQCGIFTSVLRYQAEHIIAGAGVDLVITAHEHSYERTWPTYNATVTATDYSSPTAPVYVVQGAGGNREGNDLPAGGTPWSAFRSSSVGYAVVEVPGPESLTYTFFLANGTALDTFTITKTWCEAL